MMSYSRVWSQLCHVHVHKTLCLPSVPGISFITSMCVHVYTCVCVCMYMYVCTCLCVCVHHVGVGYNIVSCMRRYIIRYMYWSIIIVMLL